MKKKGLYANIILVLLFVLIISTFMQPISIAIESLSSENTEKIVLSEEALIAEDKKNRAEQIVFSQLEVIKNTNINNVLRAAASFTLTGEVKLDAANGKGGVYLDWSSYDSTDRTFKAYQKSEGSNTWEPMSTVEFSGDVDPIQVLNIYPDVGSVGTFTYADGTTKSLSKAASLKVWMEGGSFTDSAGNRTTFEAYGKNPFTGKQIIHVTPVSSTEFNANPSMIWNYKIAMFGTWDSNGGENNQPNAAAVKVIEEYIKAGYGIVAGHDSIGHSYGAKGIGLSKLRKYFNIEIGNASYTSVTPVTQDSVEYNISWGYSSNKVEVINNGLITSFPYEISKGSQLTIPLAHTYSNAARGTVWMNFVNGQWNYGGDNYTGEGNDIFYLTTNNNAAMIQTGHSSCNSTEDERKVLANVLFYMDQRTNGTSFTANSATDKKAPDKPIKNSVVLNGTDKINVSYTGNKDNGSTYSFYVDAYHKLDPNTVIARSNEVTKTITTGVKGYYYVLDNNATNNFNISNATFTTATTLTFNLTDNGKYLHIKTVDNAGNASNVTDIQLDIKSNVVVNPNGGTFQGSTVNKTLTGLVNKTVDLGIPTRPGYTFAGWTVTGGTKNGNVYTYAVNNGTATANWETAQYTITLNNQSATTAGTTSLYERYLGGVYLDSAQTKAMTTSANPINKPARSYKVTYNYNGNGTENSETTGTYTFGGYYTEVNGGGTQMIGENGNITSNFTNTA